MIDSDKPYREGAAAVLRQLTEVEAANDWEGTTSLEGAHDVGVSLSSCQAVAVEVTRLVDGSMLGTHNELVKGDYTFPISSDGTWEVLLGVGPVNVKRAVRELGAVALDLERRGVSHAHPASWTFEPADLKVDWLELRAIFERLEPFQVLDLRRVDAGGGLLRVEGPVYGGLSSPGGLCTGIAARANAKADEVRGRGDQAWVFVWVDWTNVLPGRILRPDSDSPLAGISLPAGIDRVVASVVAFDSGEDRLPVAQWTASASPTRSWVRRAAVDVAFGSGQA